MKKHGNSNGIRTDLNALLFIGTFGGTSLSILSMRLSGALLVYKNLMTLTALVLLFSAVVLIRVRYLSIKEYKSSLLMADAMLSTINGILIGAGVELFILSHFNLISASPETQIIGGSLALVGLLSTIAFWVKPKR